MRNTTFKMTGGYCPCRPPGEKTSCPPRCVWHTPSSLYALICLRTIPGHSLPACTMKKITNVLHTVLGNLFLGCLCPLWQVTVGQGLGFIPANRQRTGSDWPPMAFCSHFSGINFKPRAALLLLFSVGGRDPLGFCGAALLRCSSLCQGLRRLEGSRSAVFCRFPCAADDSGLCLGFPSKG